MDSETEEFFINLGPQHPSTHGVLRLVLRLDGETVKEVVPHFGYIHRGIEKQAESQTYLQYIHLSDRFDYLTSHINNLGVCLAIEKAMNIGVPERAEYIRVIVNELQRISSHLVFFGSFGADMGALSVFLYAFKERELISQIFDELSGARLTMNFFRPGGSFDDVPDTFIPRVKDFIKKLRPAMKEYHRLFTGNIVFLERSKDIGILTQQQALDSGCSGPVARASGIDYDLRRDEPYSIYSEFDFGVPVRNNGDVYDRYMVRMEEMEESLKIIEQAVAKFPEGPYRSKTRPAYRLPTGTWTSVVESAKGQLGTFIVAEKGDKPYRIHTRSPSLANLSMLNEMCMDYKLADVVAILASLDPVIPEIDR
ncbi:MAG: NADH-quinone oxidoreductase subunit D [Fibrobacter sp.]|nr:NADH-quinone oxidoreductase subunit D [Fibrobacter sp.]